MDSAQGPVSTELEQARAAPEFGAHTPLSEKLLALAIRAQNFTGSTGVAIALTEGQEMVCRASWGTSAPEVGTHLSIDHSFTGLCVRTGEPLRCNDAQSDPRVDSEACRELAISAIAAAPVRRGLKVVGVIAAFSDTPNAFTDKHLLILSTLSEVIVELLDDPQPVQPLPEVFEAAPDLARAAAVAQAPVASLVDKAVVTAVLGESDVAQSQAELAVAQAATAAPEASLGAVSATGVQTAPAIPRLLEAAAPATPKKHWDASRGERPSSGSAVARGSEVLPAAMDPGLPAQQLRRSGTIASAGRTAPKSVRDISADQTLSFAGIESILVPRRRWLIPAAVLVSVGVLAFAGWRWHTRRVSSAHLSEPPITQSQSNPGVPAVSDMKAPETAAAEPQHSPFSPPPITTAAALAKARPASEVPVDVTVRRSPQPVVEADRPIRRPGASRPSGAQVPEAQAPQLALSAPELPTVLAKPAPMAVAAPVSRVLVAQLVHRVEPVYPEAARRLRLSGQVVVKATITKAGTVGNVRWASGNDLFRDATVTAVKQWRYKPATLNNQPVESDLEIVLHFNRPVNQ